MSLRAPIASPAAGVQAGSVVRANCPEPIHLHRVQHPEQVEVEVSYR
jgi:hypothetical protein